MVYSALNEKSPFMKEIFNAIDNKQNDYNWLITDFDGYPDVSNYEASMLFDQEYCWISGEEFTRIINDDDFLWAKAVISGFSKDTKKGDVLNSKLPNINGNENLCDTEIQHPLACIEIDCIDSCKSIFKAKNKELVEQFANSTPKGRLV